MCVCVVCLSARSSMSMEVDRGGTIYQCILVVRNKISWRRETFQPGGGGGGTEKKKKPASQCQIV